MFVFHSTHFDSQNKKLDLADAWVNDQDKLAQIKFNDVATKKAITGSYKNFKAFQDANADEVAMADGTTMANIKKQFDSTALEVKSLQQQQKLNDLKYEYEKSKIINF